MLMFSVALGVCPVSFISFKCHFSKGTHTCIFHFMHPVSFVNLHLVYNYQLISHLHHLHTDGFNFKQIISLLYLLIIFLPFFLSLLFSFASIFSFFEK